MATKGKYEQQQIEMLLDEIDFKKMFFIIYNNKWKILIVTLISFFIGLLYARNITPKYISTALIQVDSTLGSANNMQQMLGNMNNVFSSTSQASPADIEIALIKSRFILQPVIEKLKLNITASPRYFPFFGAAFVRRHHSRHLAKPFLGLSQFAWGGEHLEIKQFEADDHSIGSTYRLRVDSETKYRLFSVKGRLLLSGELGKLASTAEGVSPQIKILISEMRANKGTYFNISHKHNDDILRGLSQNLSIMDLGIRDKTKTGVLQLSFQDTNPAFIPQVLNAIVDYSIQKNIEKKSAEASKTLNFLNMQLPEVKNSLENAETILNEYRTKNATIDTSQEAKILLTKLSALEQSVAEVKLKKIEMLQEFMPNHPLIISLDKKRKELQKELVLLEDKIKRVPRTDQKAMNLERDVKVKDQLYLLLLNKIQQLQVLKAGTLSDIRVLNLATTPIIPLPTHKLFILLSSILLGCFATISVIFAREMLRRGVSTPEVVEERLGVPIFAIIPHSRKQKQLTRDLQQRKSNSHSLLLSQTMSKDIAIEGIRSLRTILQFSFDQARNNMISILGATANIGKSFVSTNLTQVLADSGKRVLLIDCDMRKGGIYKCLGQDKSPGFSELLTNQCHIEDVIYPISGGFDFIPTGEYPENPSELLTGRRLKELLNTLAARYDHLIIDTPPTLAVTDGAIIAKYAAINLMVIGFGTDQIEELELMVKRLKRTGITIDGLIFNNKSEAKQTYGQHNYYYAYENE